MAPVMTGLDRIAGRDWRGLKGLRLGLLANQASFTRDFVPAHKVLMDLYPGRLKAILSPQHGYYLHEQDNMIETPHSSMPGTSIPIFSLYGASRSPVGAMLEGLDALVVDLQDVGTRVYTFAATMLNCLRVCADLGVRPIILDRPNPLGGETIEGNLLSPRLLSFVGPYTLPMRHGLTMGELALLFRGRLQLDCEIQVIPMKGWERSMLWPDTGLPWPVPSPNMPLFETALVYPGQVLWEGTNISEGRGTCRPFEIFGAPFFRPSEVLGRIPPGLWTGCRPQAYAFTPTFNKWERRACRGIFLRLLDMRSFRPYRTSLALLQAVLQVHGDAFSWKPPPYEYEFVRQPIDLILGDPLLAAQLQTGRPLEEIESGWAPEIQAYRQWRAPYLLYAEKSPLL